MTPILDSLTSYSSFVSIIPLNYQKLHLQAPKEKNYKIFKNSFLFLFFCSWTSEWLKVKTEAQWSYKSIRVKKK